MGRQTKTRSFYFDGLLCCGEKAFLHCFFISAMMYAKFGVIIGAVPDNARNCEGKKSYFQDKNVRIRKAGG